MTQYIVKITINYTTTHRINIKNNRQIRRRTHCTQLDEASTQKSAKTHAGTVFVTRDLDG